MLSVTNEIPDSQNTEMSIDTVANPDCVICEFIMYHVDKALGDEKEKDKIERVVHGICNHLPKTVSHKCNNFVSKYGNVVIDILSKDVSPKEICTMMGLCSKYDLEMKGNCELLFTILMAINY